MYSNLVDRLVKVSVIASQQGCAVIYTVKYGRIVSVDDTRDKPFLVEIVEETGESFQEWYSGWNIWAIR